MNLRIGSLCSGYGGLDAAVQAVLGGEVAWVADPDPDATKVLAHHHPGVPNLGDIKLVDWASIPPIDVLTGGYPCQPFSDAGRRLGVEDERHLWPFFVPAIRVLRPRLVLLENVRGHLGRGFSSVLGDLARLGFDARWAVVRASDVGAPHRRERLFIVATAEDSDSTARGERRFAAPGQAPGGRSRADAGGRGRAPVPDSASDGRDEGRPEPARQLGRSDAAVGGTSSRCGARGDACSASGTVEPGRSGLAGVIQVENVDPVGARAIGDGVRVRRPAARNELGAQASERGADLGLGLFSGDAAQVNRGDDGREVLLSGLHGNDSLRRQIGMQEPAKTNLNWGPYEPAIRRWERVLGRPAPRPTEPGRSGERLSPRFVEWMMGLPAGHVTDVPGISRNAQLRLLGNGVVPAQGAAALAHLLNTMDAAA